MPRIIDLAQEEPLSLNQAREYLPGHPSHCTVYRYTVDGIGGVRLETVRLGRRRFTSVSAIQRFLDALAEPAV